MALVPFPQFVGSAYRSASVNVAAAETVNYYVEQTENALAQSPFPAALYPTPGLRSRWTGLQGPIRGLLAHETRLFAVGGATVYELHGNFTATVLGTVVLDDQPASLVSNGHGGHQLLIVSGGFGSIFDLNTSAFAPIADPSFPAHAVMADFLDGYFLVMQASTSKFFLSALENGLVWDATEAGSVSSSPDALMAIRVIQRNLWNLGALRTEPWVNVGSTFALQPIANVLIEFGIAAVWSLAEADGSLLFVGTSEQGGAMVFQTRGYAFARISTHAEEAILAAQTNLADARAYSYQEGGHTFYVLRLSTGPSVVYDLNTQTWSHRGVWHPGLDAFGPVRQWCHAFAFGMHVVGDYTTGTVYEQSITIGTEDGVPIRRVRVAPHVNEQYQYLFGAEVAIGAETGLATPADPNPVMELSWSKNGGHTYSSPVLQSLGIQGDYQHVPIWRRVPGRFASLTLKTVTTATVPVRLHSCFLRLEAGTGQR